MSGIYAPTPPGSPTARLYGCTCPRQRPLVRADGTARFELADACPLHRKTHAFDSDHDHAQARRSETYRDRERAA